VGLAVDGSGASTFALANPDEAMVTQMPPASLAAGVDTRQ
jgi:hypothetical protein